MINPRAPRRNLPFTRFLLGVRPVQDSLPKGMENVPLHVWTDFWSRMDVLAKHVNLLDTMGRAISFLLFAGTSVVILFQMFTHALTSHVELFILAVCIVFLLLAGLLYLKQYNFKKLKNFLSEEEARTFLPCGFVLECHDELPLLQPRPGGYYLYFIPSMTNGNDNNDLSPPEMSCQRGYLRVEVAKVGLCSWNTSPALPFYDYLPDGMVSVSLADWSEFWSKMDIVTSTAMPSIRRRQWLMWLNTVLILSYVSVGHVNDTVALVFMIVIILCQCLGCYTFYPVRSIDAEIQNVFNEYAVRFEEQGVYMEFRREHDWTALTCLTVGGMLRRYIYLFPIQQSF